MSATAMMVTVKHIVVVVVNAELKGTVELDPEGTTLGQGH